MIVVSGSVEGLTAIAGLTTTVYAWLAVADTLSVAVIVKFDVAALVGVPLITPVLASRLSPVGKLPEVTANVLAPVPPVAETV